MKAVCYFHDCSVPECPHELLARWARSFDSHGFDPIVLDESAARKHPRFDEIDAMMGGLPTVNGKEYERACWLRWLAYATVAPAIFTDIDVINFDFLPHQVELEKGLISYQTYGGPACVSAGRNEIEGFIDHFKNAHGLIETYDGKPHVSDMHLFRGYYKGKATAHMWDCCYPFAMEAPLVHFGNACVPHNQRGMFRHLAVDEFTQKRKEFYALREALAS